MRRLFIFMKGMPVSIKVANLWSTE